MGREVGLEGLGEKLKLNEGYTLKNPDFIADITSKKFQFVSVIEALSEILTHQDVIIRQRGVDFLSWVLTELPPDLFNSQEITAVVNFYSDRLKDHHSIAPATIRGLLALVKMKNIQKETVKHFLVPLFQEMNCQTLQQSDRYNIFSIVGFIVENHLQVVAEMGPDFVFGIISLADGETDPSNLFLLFQFLPLLFKKIDLGHLTEEMFDLLSCYFPVDFNSAGNSISITRENLADGLMNCLSAKAEFSENCLPLILEKLDSSLKTARIDSYKLLGACCSTYSVESINNRLKEFWKFIQKDVLPVVDIHICEAALYALSEIIKLFDSVEWENLILKNFLDDILTSIKTLFTNVEDSLFQPAMNVLLAVSSKSSKAAKYVLSHLKFVFNANLIKTPSQRKISLSCLRPFLPILRVFRFSDSSEFDSCTTFTEISRFYVDSIQFKNPEVQKLAFIGLQEIVPYFSAGLSNDLLLIVMQYLKSEQNEELRLECLKTLRQLAALAPNNILEVLKTNFSVNGDVSVENANINSFMSALSAVVDIEGITDYAVPQIINIITNSIHFDIGLTNLLSSCRKAQVDSCKFLITVHKKYNLIEKLITWRIKSMTESRQMEDSSSKALSEIIALIVRHQDVHIQQSIIDIFLPLLLNTDKSVGIVSFEANIIIIEAIVGSIRRSVKIDNLPELLRHLLNSALTSNDEGIRLSSSRAVAAIINKMGNNSTEYLDLCCDIIFQSLNSLTRSEKLNGANLFNWVVKGLVLANSSYLESLILKWFDLLGRDDIGWIIAEGIRLVLQEEELYLNIESHCNVKILYRQRFFASFPTLMKYFESAVDYAKTNYLLALIYLIDGVAKHVVVTELEKVVLVIVQALDSEKLEAVSASLRILNSILQEKEVLLGGYVHTIVPKLLKLSRYEGNMKIRINALAALHRYAFYPTVIILPLKTDVITGLEPCLDDKKRLVRREAVRARSRWFLVGAPGEDAIFLS